MLQTGLQVIVNYKPSGSSSICCRGFVNVRMLKPSLVVFSGMDAAGEAVATRLAEEFCERMLSLAGATEAPASMMPCCGSHTKWRQSHPGIEQERHELLVLAGGDMTRTPARTLNDLDIHWKIWIKCMSDEKPRQVLPVLSAGARVNEVLPKELEHLNIAFWETDAGSEVLPGVMQLAGLAPEDYRIFISYIRKETTELAEQLHEALTRAGFAVFVDRFNIPAGVHFQERLMQELTDRGMLLLLHSKGLGTSRWVEDEIAMARKHRLGLFVLRLPGEPERDNLAPDRSRPITKDEWDEFEHKLRGDALSVIVHEIKRVHYEAHQRQLQRLANNLAAEVMDPARPAHGCTLRVETGGLFVISRPSSSSGPDEVVLNLTARPPELRDFHHTHVHGEVSAGRRGGIIAPAPFIEERRRAWFDWLGKQSHLRHLDEGQMRLAVDQIIAGNF